jgi:PAS domain S-box-containing protein
MTFTSNDPLATLTESSPAMLWQGDIDGRCVYLNAAMRAFWGLAVDDGGSFDWATSLLEADQERVFGPFSKGMQRQEEFSCEGRYRRHDGEIRVLRTRAVPNFDTEGRFAGMIGVNEDLTELRAAEAELEKTNKALASGLAHQQRLNERLRLATSISGLAMSEHDSELRYTWAHNLPEDVIGKTPAELVGDEVGASLHAILGRSLSGEPQSEEIPLAINGVPRWFHIQTAQIIHPDGSSGVVASALDVTSHRLNHQKLEILARELSHRVKNVFSVVQALVRQSAKASGAPQDFVASVEARLHALGAAQDALIASGENQVMIGDFLRGQLAHVSGVIIEGPDLHIPGGAAPYLALATHELSTNSLKYGALSSAGGSVSLSWKLTGPDVLEVTWREAGGPAFVAGSKAGFGSVLLTKIFAAATAGKVELGSCPEGLRWRAEFPIKVSVDLGPHDAPH